MIVLYEVFIAVHYSYTKYCLPKQAQNILFHKHEDHGFDARALLVQDRFSLLWEPEVSWKTAAMPEIADFAGFTGHLSS